MLRITKIDTPTEQKLILEGRLTEPWIADLSSHWEDMRHAHPKRKFVVDLRGVTRSEFFREAFSKACEDLNLAVTGFRERELDQCVLTTFGKAAAQTQRQISTLGRFLGPPWTKDQKTAALAALLVLANQKTAIPADRATQMTP